ncbi:alcohol dehydrogenase catalytic domain-containing protein [Actinomadura latina]|uniref:alcohol dehydrogenase catalytic domain-containing protein n=1 Tax=Actinomadura latina TaxID=163603 RepID=UPI00082E2D9A|nr:alcohol dehydrogenase catalytic domain-containing protein [Actinomadura latina]
MRAIQQAAWGGAETMAVVEVAEPEPVFGEVLVRVMAAGVNPVDVYTRRGQAYNRVLDLPFVNGWDVAGEVVETGYGTSRFRPGDRVFGMPWFPRAAGGYAALPFACHWTVRDGLIAHERFFFDFHQMCEQLGLPTEAAAAKFAAWRERAEETAR